MFATPGAQAFAWLPSLGTLNDPMGRPILDAFAADISGLAATAMALMLSFGVWSLTGLRAPPATPATSDAADAGAPTPPPPPTSPSAHVESASIEAPPKPQAPRSYNVILLTVDTLRYDLGFMGYPRPVTPKIDALAERSVVYERMYAMASFTPKCLGPMLIGRYVSETERDYQHYTNFGPSNVFLAERVQAAGAHTVGAASHRYFGWKKGFDQGFDVWDTSAIPPNSVDNDPTITSGTLTDTAIRILSSQDAREIPVHPKAAAIPPRVGPAKDRFFAWFHYLDPHLPYVYHEGAPKFGAMPGAGIPRERAPYDGEVWYTDQQIGRLLEHIAAQPWASETAIILTADHGEAFGEHGHWGHGRELWEPLVRVPFLIYIPGVEPRRISVKRSHIDVVPTILELMNVPGDSTLRGKSLLADFGAGAGADAGAIEERDVYIDMPDGPYNELRRAIIHGPSPGMKLIEFQGGRRALYDLSVDPGETKNLAGDRERLAEATAAMARVRQTVREIPPKK